MAALTERVSTETNETIAVGQRLQAALEQLHGKRTTEAISLPWALEGAVLVAAGESATRDHVIALDEAIRNRLNSDRRREQPRAREHPRQLRAHAAT